MRIHASSFGTEARGRRDDPLEPLDLPQPAERVRQRASLLDPRVDRDTGAQRRVLDRLEQRHGDCDLVPPRSLLRVLQRHDEQVGRDERRLLGAGDANRRIQHRRVERARERDEDAPLALVTRPWPAGAVDEHGGGRDEHE